MAFFESSPQASILYQANSYKSVGSLLVDLVNTAGNTANKIANLKLNGDTLQRNDLFFKTHVMDMGSSSMDPQREWMYMLYIGDVKGRYWNDVGLNYANFGQQMMDHLYGIANGTVKTAMYLGLIDLIKTAGKKGTTSPQQELVYRVNSVTMPTRNVDSVVTQFMGSKNNQPVNVSYQGELTCQFEEGEDAFILRQFNSWLSAMDESSAARAELDVSSPTSATKPNDIASKISKRVDAAKGAINPFANAPLDFDISLAKQMKTDIDMFMFRYSGEDVCYKITYYNCYPTSIGGAQWSYSGNAGITYSVNFSYDYFKIHYIRSPLRPRVNKLKTWLAATIDKALENIMTQLFVYMFRAVSKKAAAKLWDKKQSAKHWPVERIYDHEKSFKDAKANMILPYEKDSANKSLVEKLKKKLVGKTELEVINPSKTSWNPDVDEDGIVKITPRKDDGNGLRGPDSPPYTKNKNTIHTRLDLSAPGRGQERKVPAGEIKPLDIKHKDIPYHDDNGVKGPLIPTGKQDKPTKPNISPDKNGVKGPLIPTGNHDDIDLGLITELNKGQNIRPAGRYDDVSKLLSDLTRKIKRT